MTFPSLPTGAGGEWWAGPDFLEDLGLTPSDFPENPPTTEGDAINHPSHYTAYPVEVIELTEHMTFCAGNVIKYVSRAGLKNPDTEIEDLKKARWYIDREISRLEGKK